MYNSIFASMKWALVDIQCIKALALEAGIYGMDTVVVLSADA